MDTNRAYNHPGFEEGSFMVNNQKPAPMNQNGPHPYQYGSPLFRECAASGQQLGVPEKRGYNGQHAEGQERNQIQTERGEDWTRALMNQNGQHPHQYSSPSFHEFAASGQQLGVPEKCGYNGKHAEGQERNQIQTERGEDWTRAPMHQNGQHPQQYGSPSFHESAPSGQQLSVSEKLGYNGQHAEGQKRNQIQPVRGEERMRALENLAVVLKFQLDDEKKKSRYYKGKAMEFYKKYSIRDPRILAECHRKAQANRRAAAAAAAAAANAASSPFSSPYLDAILPSHRSPTSPSSAAVPSVPAPTALLSSPTAFAIPPSAASSSSPRQTAVPSVTSLYAPRQTAVPSVTASPNQRQTAVPSITASPNQRQTAVPSATRLFAPHQTAVPSLTPLTRSPAPSHTAVPAVAGFSAPLGPASPAAAPLIFIDLTLDKSPSCPPSRSQKRKRSPEQESDEGVNARKKILSKSFDWMKPKDRPNFKTKNPYQAESTGVDTEYDDYDYDLGQARQESPLPQVQAPAHPPASAKLSDSLENQHSNHRARKTNTRKRQETAKTRRQAEARERLKTKKKQIMNETTAEETQGQEVEDYEAMGEELEAELEKQAEGVDKQGHEAEDYDAMAEEMEAALGNDEAEDFDKMAEEMESWLGESSFD